MARALHAERLEADCQLALYTHFVRVGQVDSGNSARKRAVAILTRLGDYSALSGALQWNGYLLSSIGDLERAYVVLREAEGFAKTSGNMMVMGWTALNLAQVYIEFGQFAEAEEQLTTAQRRAQETGDGSLVELLFGAQAQLAESRHDFVAAERALAAYRAAQERSGRPDLVRNALSSSAILQARRGNYQSALALIDSAAALRVRYRLTGFETSDINARASIYYLAGRLDSARVLADSVIARLDSWDHGPLFTLNLLRAGISARQSDTELARAQLSRAEREYDSWHKGLTDAQMLLRASQVSFFGVGEMRGMGEVFDVLARKGDAADVFEFDERRRARDLRERMARVAAARASRATHTTSVPSLSVAQLQRALPDDRTAIVQFAAPVSAEKTTILALTRTGLRSFVAPDLDSLTPAITRFSNFVRQGVVPADAALALGRVLFGEVVRWLPPGVSRLMIVRDGVLHRLPIDALQIEPGVSIIDRYATASAPSSSVASALWERARRVDTPRILAFGDPVLPKVRADSAQPAYAEAMLRGEPLKRLAASEREVRAASRDTPGSVVFTGKGATEQALKSAILRDFRVVHFATHALVDDWSLARTSMILAPGRGEDGFVTPDELSRLSFDADVVVLSACRTAAGELVGSEGIRGLATPLLEAGARSIVATQWEVGDAAAARLSADLHRALRAGEPVIDAARTARLASRRRGDSPASWAVLAVIGDSHARPFLGTR
jgi:tetratricopeptide (TPR) repeat protein